MIIQKINIFLWFHEIFVDFLCFREIFDGFLCFHEIFSICTRNNIYVEIFLKFQVFYIDYGHTKWVHWKEIRKIPSLELKLIDHLAVECRLEGCYPTLPNNKWTYQAVNTIKEFMKGALMLRIHVDDFDEFFLNNVCVEVDNPSRDNYDPVILNKYLFMTKLATWQKPRLLGKFFWAIFKYFMVGQKI